MHEGGLSPKKGVADVLGRAIGGVVPVRKFGSDGGTTRRGAQNAGDPARGNDGLLWEIAVPWGVNERNGACTVWFVRDAGAAGGVRVGSHVWLSVEP